jgi:hypothetical protein
MSNLKVVQFPGADVRDVAAQLRALADAVEKGEMGDAHNIAWVMDCGDSRLEFGMMGQSESFGANFVLLLNMALHRFMADLTSR